MDEWVGAEIPGLPLIGNLLQLKEKKPHKTFAKWAEKYGPIYSIRTGASTVIVLNSTDVAKEVTFLSSFLHFPRLHLNIYCWFSVIADQQSTFLL